MRKISGHDNDCWFPMFALTNFECLDWKIVFFSEKNSEEGYYYDCEKEPVKRDCYDCLLEWNNWFNIVMSFYCEEILDGKYSVEYKYDAEHDRIIIKIKEHGKVIDVIYFWLHPIDDESEWDWKD